MYLIILIIHFEFLYLYFLISFLIFFHFVFLHSALRSAPSTLAEQPFATARVSTCLSRLVFQSCHFVFLRPEIRVSQRLFRAASEFKVLKVRNLIL